MERQHLREAIEDALALLNGINQSVMPDKVDEELLSYLQAALASNWMLDDMLAKLPKKQPTVKRTA
jgi:hypothetical protein